MKRVYVDLSRCLGCKSCEIACAIAHSTSRRSEVPLDLDLYTAIAEDFRQLSRAKVILASVAYYPPISMSIQCRHCEKPLCVAACVTGALYKEPEGLVSFKPERCIGCRMCVMLCPYGAIRINKRVGVAVKCDLCPQEKIPACVKSCPTKALIYAEEEEILKTKYGIVSKALETIMTSQSTLIRWGSGATSSLSSSVTGD